MAAPWLVVARADGTRVPHAGGEWAEDAGALLVTDTAGAVHRYEPGEWFSVQPSEITPAEWDERVEQAQAEEAAALAAEKAAQEREQAVREAEEAAQAAAAVAEQAAVDAERAAQEAAAAQRALEEATAVATTSPGT